MSHILIWIVYFLILQNVESFTSTNNMTNVCNPHFINWFCRNESYPSFISTTLVISLVDMKLSTQNAKQYKILETKHIFCVIFEGLLV